MALRSWPKYWAAMMRNGQCHKYSKYERLGKDVWAGLNRLVGRQLAAVRASLPGPGEEPTAWHTYDSICRNRLQSDVIDGNLGPHFPSPCEGSLSATLRVQGSAGLPATPNFVKVQSNFTYSSKGRNDS